VLEGRDMGDVAREQVGALITSKVNEYTQSDVFEEWDLAGMQTLFTSMWPLAEDLTEIEPNSSSREQVAELMVDDAMGAYDEREEEFGEELMRALERHILLQIIDQRWKEHLHEMDYLREGIHLRGFAQIDPLVAYKNEGFLMFESLMDSIWEEYTRLIFHVNVELQPSEVEERFGPGEEPTDIDYSGGTAEDQPSALRQAAGAAGAGAAAAGATGAAASAGGEPASPENPETVVKPDHEKIGRNDPCWCGSGKKYKKCHGA
jgi:preprotein translocase subunit SecA